MLDRRGGHMLPLRVVDLRMRETEYAELGADLSDG
jgi:hypothetical protein